MEKVHLISRGSYSDYEILFAMKSKEAAEAFVARANPTGDSYEGPYYEEVDLRDPPEVRDELRLSAKVSEDFTEDREEIRQAWDRKGWTPAEARQYVSQGFMGSPPYVEVFVSGFDHKRVRKVFSERVAQAKADWAVLIEKDRIEREDRREVLWRVEHNSEVS